MKKYNLASYILSIEPNDSKIQSLFGTISIGGEGSYSDSISLTHSNSIFETESFATGAWVHNKNLAKTGTAVMSLSQLSDNVVTLIKMCNTFFQADYDGFTLTLTDIAGNKIATCIDCYIQKIPDQSYEATASKQTWTFTCGEINFGS